MIDRLLQRLELGRERYGELDLSRPREWRRELREELLDALVYDVGEELAAEDVELAQLRAEAATEQELRRRPAGCRCHLEAGDTLCPVHPPPPEELAYAASIGSYLLEPLDAPVTVIAAVSIMDADPATKAKALDALERECRTLTAESELPPVVLVGGSLGNPPLEIEPVDGEQFGASTVRLTHEPSDGGGR